MNMKELLHELFEYKDGNLYNRFTRSPKAVKGEIAGSFNKSNNRYRVTINQKGYQLSRLIWIYHNGDIPENIEVDHINQDKADNRTENLRLATRQQNEWNKTSKGYRFESGKWRARIRLFGKYIYIGVYDTEEEASFAYANYAKQYRGEFAA